MNKDFFKKYLAYMVAIVIFIAIVIIYCYPIVFEDKVMNQSDVKNWEGMAQETRDFAKKTDTTSWWTNSMFSGMPTFQITGSTPSLLFLNKIGKSLHLFLPSVLGLLIGYFIGFFILLRSFGVNKWLCIIGAIAITFSSYFLIVIAAGHNTKAATIGYMAAVIGGFFLIFRKKYFWGVPIVVLFACVGMMQHPQMSYYIFMAIGCLFIAELFIHIKEKRYKDLVIAVLLFAASVGIAAGTRYGINKANAEYLTETMRGGHSELTNENDAETLSKSSGLSLDYATQWSYGIDETMTLMIPNFMGGSSHYNIGTDSDIYKQLISNRVPRQSAADFCKALPMYWGDQSFTSGPVYIGAIVCFLFVLGLFLVKGPYKWALLVATLFSIALSWGHNWMGLTKLFFEYFPMYSKFRAVSSILIVAEITMPLLGFLAVKAIMDKNMSKEKILKSIYYSGGITAGICLIFAVFGKALFSFSSPNDAQVFSQLPNWLSEAIVAERASMLRADSFRSFIFIALAAVVFWLFVQEKIKFSYFTLALGLLILIDMWPVNKRYFGNEYFVSEKQDDSYFKKTPYEEQILQDTDPYFRVLNVTTNTFNDARTSYYLKSIGGYHGAKLRRYQDLINEHISKNNMDVLNMLNTKYFIVKGPNGQPIPQQNPFALGNAWFVDTLRIVNTPDEESEALNQINPAITAVTDKKFADFATQPITVQDPTARITLTKYAPNALDYKSVSNVDKTAVFSDIYYPYGWKAYIDGQPVEHFRVNYVLRALNIPAGEHDIRFVFYPDSLYKGENISIACIIFMFVIIAFCIIYPNWKRKKTAVKEK